MSDVTGNLVGLSGNVLYKFEALVGGIFLVFSAFKLTPDLSVVRLRARAVCVHFQNVRI